MTIDEWLRHSDALESAALAKLQMLRIHFPEAAEFGIHAAQVIDSLTNELTAASPEWRTGRWDDEERDALRRAYQFHSGNDAVEQAQKHIKRSRAQIRAMAGNMKLTS